MTAMTSSKPYLVRAMYEWIVDNNLTPYIVVDANATGVIVPQRFVENGQIILNMSPQAVQKLLMNNDEVEFYAGFSGIVQRIYMPVNAIQAIYAFENGRGMMFQGEEDEGEAGRTSVETKVESPKTPPKKGRPDLKIIK